MAIRQRMEWDSKIFHDYINIGGNINTDDLRKYKDTLDRTLRSSLDQWFPKGGPQNPGVPWKGHKVSVKNILTRAVSNVVRAHQPVCKRAREGQGVRAE
ncbi:hypothetical protein EVAR_10987_1 [Eumeta japonica]|uniref:Uncharacterized protein n=1 Tax=Eumeta variegata TaxID=151549 RepID=A0A4C1U698_EUMVA|nr:hypothetical protein EVAR_10987_1 [Eumeta japonica]